MSTRRLVTRLLSRSGMERRSCLYGLLVVRTKRNWCFARGRKSKRAVGPQTKSGASGSEGLATGEHVPDRVAKAAGDVDLGDSLNCGAPVGSCAGRAATIVGTERADNLRGTKGDDVIAAGGGDAPGGRPGGRGPRLRRRGRRRDPGPGRRRHAQGWERQGRAPGRRRLEPVSRREGLGQQGSLLSDRRDSRSARTRSRPDRPSLTRTRRSMSTVCGAASRRGQIGAVARRRPCG